MITDLALTDGTLKGSAVSFKVHADKGISVTKERAQFISNSGVQYVKETTDKELKNEAAAAKILEAIAILEQDETFIDDFLT